MNTAVIYTEKNNCQDCYKCITKCPVKSIKIEDNSASVISDLCIYCGQCVLSCPVHAKNYREDYKKVQWMIDSGEKVVACIAPSIITDFKEISIPEFYSYLKELGFNGVSETANGAEIVAQESQKWLEDQPNGVYISSCCPSIVNYISIYFPMLIKNIAPIVSPMVAHGNQVKKSLGKDVKTVFIGPCIAKKQEADIFSNSIDVAITFKELKKWFDDEMLQKRKISQVLPENFILGKPSIGNLFPIDGGMLTNMKTNTSVIDFGYMTFSGMKIIKDIINEIPDWKPDKKIFLELMACEGGCVKGPGMNNREGLITKREKILFSSSVSNEFENITAIAKEGINTKREFSQLKTYISCIHSEDEIQNVLFSMGKWTEKDELNCTGCGYENCREFAKAMLDGKAERTMCISYMRKVAQDKASILLQKIPYGVVMVDENLTVIDCNKKFAEMIGGETLMIFENNPGLPNADLTKLVSFHKLFSTLLASGEEIIEQDVRDGDNYYHVSIISIQKFKIICGIIENFKDPDIQHDIIGNRIQDVIRQNMEAVQRIAYLLGENASYTESMLNSIIETKQLK